MSSTPSSLDAENQARLAEVEEIAREVDANELSRSSSRPDDPPPEAAIRPPSKYSAPFSYQSLALIAPGAIFGLLARLGLNALTSYDGQSVFSLAWVQGMGCFVMGLAAGLREPIAQFYAPLYFAIATGFCGSLTTFSSWNLDVFLAWENAGGYNRVWLYDIIDALTQLGITFAISLSSLALGLHFADLILPHIPLKLPRLPYPARYTLTFLSISACILTIPLYFVLPHAYRHQATAALLFCYPGALLRHVLGIKLNPIRKGFPLGTFAANMIATVIIGITHTLQHRSPSSKMVTPLSCVMLQALADGFCGCLSTVSTFAVEVRGLRGGAWTYASVSVVASQLILVLVTGIPWWAGGSAERLACAFES